MCYNFLRSSQLEPSQLQPDLNHANMSTVTAVVSLQELFAWHSSAVNRYRIHLSNRFKLFNRRLCYLVIKPACQSNNKHDDSTVTVLTKYYTKFWRKRNKIQNSKTGLGARSTLIRHWSDQKWVLSEERLNTNQSNENRKSIAMSKMYATTMDSEWNISSFCYRMLSSSLIILSFFVCLVCQPKRSHTHSQRHTHRLMIDEFLP